MEKLHTIKKARKILLESLPIRKIAAISPTEEIMLFNCPPPNTASPRMISEVELIAPRNTQLNIAVIASTACKSEISSFAQSVAFAGYLIGLGYIGHSVVTVNLGTYSLVGACHDADLLIIDGKYEHLLPNDWQAIAIKEMRLPHMTVFSPNGTRQNYIGSRNT